jgi:Bacterial Ig-like domain
MKKKSTSQSAFFNLRVLVGLFVGMTGISLALFAANPLGRGAGPSRASATKPVKAQQKYKVTTRSSINPLVPAMIDCSKIKQFGIDRQENFRAGAIMIFCGLAEGGKPDHVKGTSKFVQKLMAPVVYGGTDVNLITGTENFPNVTQSETYSLANPDDPNQIVVAFNDSRGINASPINISGASVSNDGGLTFTRLTKANGQSPFDNTFGDPVVLYNSPTGTWFTVWLDAGCGFQGLGGYKSTTPDDPNSWTHFCIFNESGADRESGWSDNNPSSPFFGRMYVSWNDFDVGGTLKATFSSDNGNTWHSPVTVFNGAVFMRDVQITGDLAGSGTIYIAGMDEGGGGFPHQDTNYIFKSTDGGNTWTNTYGPPASPSFPGPGVTACGDNPYFSCMFPDAGGFWRHEGWGQPAAINNFVHLVYAQQGTGSDPGDVYYIRSTDGGSTFSSPLKLNTDGGTRPQWQPNLSVSPTGTLLATWYDARESASCTKGDPNVPCYRMWSRKSLDNGANWLPDDMFSDVVTPLPGQPDPGIVFGYAGDYDYGSAITVKHLTSWVDGRVAISGQSQQDAFTDRDLVGFAVIGADPACGSVVFPPAPTDFTVNLTDPVDPSTVQASDFTVNGTPADSFALSNGDTTITFSFTSTPVVGQGPQTMHIPAGAFEDAADGDPVLEFTCDFLFDELQLEVVDTVPPDGGTFTLPPQQQDLLVNFNEEIDPSSVQTTDLQLSGINGANVTNVTVSGDNLSATFTINFPTLGSLTATIPAGAITDQFGNPNAAFSGNYTVGGCVPDTYIITPGADTIVPGDTNIGSDCDDCDTVVALPFNFSLYGTQYNSVNVSSNGRLDFVCANEPGGYNFLDECIPPSPNVCPYDFTIFGLWEDFLTFASNPGCAGFPGGTCGIFTSVSGSAPDRIFNIEWRTVLYNDSSAPQNFEIRLYENPNLNQRFEVIIGTLTPANADHPWVSGVQGASGVFTQDFCIPAGGSPPQNESRTYEIQPCGSPTPTPTPSVTPTPTPGTPTPTPTVTVTPTPSVTPTATPRVTPRPRPTPHPRPTP